MSLAFTSSLPTAAMLALLVLCGCAPEPSGSPPTSEAASLAIPHPPLDGVEPEVALAIETQRAKVDALAGRSDVPSADRAQAIGRLGQLYQVHRLIDASLACYREAHVLDPGAFEWAYYLGVLAARGGELEEAVGAFQAAVELRPGDLQALIRLADLELDRGEIDAASRLYDKAWSLDQTMAAAVYGMGRVAAERRSYDEAIAHFDTALALEPRATIIHYHLGQAHRQLEQLEEAKNHLALSGPVKVSIPDPLMSQVNALATGSALFLVQGNTALRDGRLSVAASAFRRAIEANPENPKARQSLATVFTLLRDLESAVEQLEVAVRLTPRNAQARSDLGSALAELGRDDRALEHLQQAVELDPNLQQAQFNLANALARLGRLDEAERHYRHLLEIDPENVTARSRLGTILAQAGDLDRAIPELRRVVELDGQNAQARLNLGIALAEAGDLAGADTQHQKLLELETDDETTARAYFNLGTFSLRANDPSRALERFQQALEYDDSISAAHLNVGNLQATAGRLTEAAAHFARARELAPGDPRPRVGEAATLLHLGHFAEAKTALEEAVRSLPDEITLVYPLARLLAAAPDNSLRDGNRSLELIGQALETATRPSFVETRAMALAEVGRFDEAVANQRAVLAEAEKRGRQAEAQRLAQNLERYAAGLTCCANANDVRPAG